jgi:cytosine/uracil/thiamine/allantoin permease
MRSLLGFILAGIGVVMASISGWLIVEKFPSSDLFEPFRDRATHYNQKGINFFVFSSFVVYMAWQVTGFVLGISLIGFSALTAWRYLIRPLRR